MTLRSKTDKFCLPSIAFLVCSVLLLTACTSKPELPDLPDGQQTLTGSFIPTALSLSRRGTHQFTVDGTPLYLAESSAIPLRRYENKVVVATGTIEHNLDPYTQLPVFVVQSIPGVLEEPLNELTIQSLGITVQAPSSWQESIEADETTFRIADLPEPLIRIYTIPTPEQVPAGTPLVIGRERAIRSVDEAADTQQVMVWVPDAPETLVLTFSPQGHIHRDRLQEQWLTFLRSITIKNTATASVGTTGTGGTAADGPPCGGEAGILCPEGFYCDITHLQENIGRCKAL